MARKGAARTGVEGALGPLERRVMRALWAAGKPLTVGEVRSAMRGKRLAYTTVMTSLNRLTAKGLLARKPNTVHWGYAYEAKATPEQLAAEVARRVIQSIAPGALDAAVCHLLGLDPVKGADVLATLRKKAHRSRRR
jgi:predicted transcriptional regulator